MNKPPVTSELDADNPVAISAFGNVVPSEFSFPAPTDVAVAKADVHLGNLSDGLPKVPTDTTASMPGLPALDIQLATAEFRKKYPGQQSREICAKAVREACLKAGMDFPHNPRLARDYDAYLPTQGFARIAGGRAGRFDDSPMFYQPVPGDIVVIQKPGQQGHIAMYTKDGKDVGGHWRADFVHMPGDMFGISYRGDPKCTFAVFRHPTLGGALANAINLVDQATPPPVTSALGSLRIETARAPTSGAELPQVNIRQDEPPSMPITLASTQPSSLGNQVRLALPAIKS